MQYIDTEFYPNQDTSIEFIASQIEDTKGTERAWFGGRDAANFMEEQNAYAFWELNKKFVPYYGDEDNKIPEIDVVTNKKYTIYMNKNITNIDGIKYMESTYKKFKSLSTLTLFGTKTYMANEGLNEENSVDKRMASLRLYSCKIWDNNELIRDYIPVKDKSNIPSLFDKVTRKFYYNVGTGEGFKTCE